ncbi:hypothetical protein MNBD_GAMMA25-369 [hydrothermal vent metagenome]|uniref:Uncharacterized protein n=1 Tax=hydrothermal vent metagenome TaxID=652676 RepID=A0A3B1BAZ1_9ZZZZ
MQRNIIKIMVFFLLLSNLSWAVDMDVSLDAYQHEHEIGSQNNDNGNLSHAPADECSHGSAHMFGIFSEVVLLPSVLNNSYLPVLVNHRYFICQQPPTPPPTA